MRIVQTTAPVREPILLDEVKEHLRIESDHEDAAIASFIAAARAVVEAATGLYLIDRSVDIYVDRWSELMPQQPNHSRAISLCDHLVPISGAGSPVKLPVRPVGAVTSIMLVDDGDVEAEWALENYQLQPGLEPTLHLAVSAAWPTPARDFGGIKISVTAGFGADWNAVPETIQQAVKMMVAKLYLCRGDEAVAPANLLKASGAGGLLRSFGRVQL